MYQAICEDCLKVFPQLPEGSIDMVLADVPQGITKCKWDIIIPVIPMWKELNRIVKPNGAIVIMSNQPFTSMLIINNIKMFRYCLVYQKTTPTGYLNANKMPLRAHEDVIVFYKKLPTYNPQKTFGHKRKISSKKHKRNCIKTEVYGNHKLTSYDSTERYPISVLKFSTDKQKSKYHPTQKPITLIEYLIKTYSNKDDIILDFAMGIGTTGIGCINLNRNFIGIELMKEYCEIAIKEWAKKGIIVNIQNSVQQPKGCH